MSKKKNYDEFVQTAAELIKEEEQGSSVTLWLEVFEDELPAILKVMKRRLTPRQEREIFARVLAGEKQAAIATEFNMKKREVSQLVRRLKDEQSE